jgi:methylase of polypeptide subunit release factors
MDKVQASNIVKNTFEKPFDKTVFISFIKNLLNQIEEAPFTYKGNYIHDSFKEYIASLERIGKYSDGEHTIDILIVQLKKETSIERARAMQRNYIAKYLNGSRGGEMKDAALVAFVSPNTEDWRFSLVKMDYKFEKNAKGKIKVKEEFTPARRWSFLVGTHENSHTAQSRLVPLIADDTKNPTLAELEESFNIEKVTKEFFEKYRELFLRTKEELDKIIKNDSVTKTDFEKKNVNTVDFSKKLLGQIVFLYFLQKKGWFGVQRDSEWGTGSKQFLRELFEKRHGSYNNFFNDILEPLFYEALRIDRSHDDHYYSRFNCKIPFLNGGLFDPMNGYDWVKTDILIPNELFSNSKKTQEGDTGDGILDIFDRYNFTVKEDEPLEKEVAIDPELLGKAYEKFNAIRPDNYAEFKKALKSGKKGDESKFNKQYGVYYTPREIVHYMCQQSLINYLYTELNDGIVTFEKFGDEQTDMFGNEGKTGQLDLTIEHKSKPVIPKEDIETLIHFGEHVSENEAHVEKAGKETDTYYYIIPDSIRNNAEKIDNKLANIKVCDPAIGSGAFPVGMMSEIVRARNALTPYIKDINRSAYHFKRECIENSLYGVDIDPGAVEIAKLRLWLSLVVDEDDIKQIKPLPNLDYKIVCGNSLLGVEKNLFNSELFKKLEEIKPLYFNETNPTKKQKYKKEIDGLISQITDGHAEFDFEIYFSEVFHEKGGFDVIIGNPPYVEHKKLKGISNTLKVIYSTYSGTADLYVYFYEKGIRILRENGSLFYITSNKFIKTSYGEKLRKYFTSYQIIEIIDFTSVHVFEALVASCIICITKRNFSNNNIILSFIDDTLLKFADLKSYIDENKFSLNQNLLSEKIGHAQLSV